jgi:hypothetical protein
VGCVCNALVFFAVVASWLVSSYSVCYSLYHHLYYHDAEIHYWPYATGRARALCVRVLLAIAFVLWMRLGMHLQCCLRVHIARQCSCNSLVCACLLHNAARLLASGRQHTYIKQYIM